MSVALHAIAGRILRDPRRFTALGRIAPDVAIRARTFYYAGWEAAAPLVQGGFAATPRSVLLGVRASLLPNTKLLGARTPTLVFITRSKNASPLRGKLVGEKGLQKAARDAARAASPLFNFSNFAGELSAP